ncbi:hypothetical protein FIBSPDRAFT_1004706 [Athelia psychrophila]|uniref:Uncharacterized protein n=1 Tax=Athelia psychrophila TaxID=1759441 RepID=A0A167VY95_9AGAM|nr:hypothetical protein FIBSPDRAFT_1004706 [Fibularhizoctonia sp. CBS 109695]
MLRLCSFWFSILRRLKRVEVTTAMQPDRRETSGSRVPWCTASRPSSLRSSPPLGTTFLRPQIILIAQTEEPADLGRGLGAEEFGEDVVREPGHACAVLLDETDDGIDDASADGIALAVADAAVAIAGVAVAEELDAVGQGATPLHGEVMLVVAACDVEDAAILFVAGDLLDGCDSIEYAAVQGELRDIGKGRQVGGFTFISRFSPAHHAGEAIVHRPRRRILYKRSRCHFGDVRFLCAVAGTP